MKVMVLAAGYGKRMLPLTRSTPKPLLQVGGRTLIEWHLERLANAGFTDVVINHHHLGEQIEQRLGDGTGFGIRIRYSAEPELLETGGGIVKALPMLGDEPFLVLNSDIWTDFDFARLVRLPDTGVLAHLVLVPNAAHHPEGDFCLTEDDRLCRDGPADRRHTFSGISVLHPALFTGLPVSPMPLPPLLIRAMSFGRVTGELYRGQWRDIGTPARLQALDHELGHELQSRAAGLTEEKPDESR